MNLLYRPSELTKPPLSFVAYGQKLQGPAAPGSE